MKIHTNYTEDDKLVANKHTSIHVGSVRKFPKPFQMLLLRHSQLLLACTESYIIILIESLPICIKYIQM